MLEFPTEIAGFETSATFHIFADRYMFCKIFINSVHYKSKKIWQDCPKDNLVSISFKNEHKKPILLLDPTNRNYLHTCLR